MPKMWTQVLMSNEKKIDIICNIIQEYLKFADKCPKSNIFMMNDFILDHEKSLVREWIESKVNLLDKME